MTSHLAVVLAAGGSTRLGRPKQLLRRNGETLVHRAVRLASMTRPARLLVVIGANAAPIAAELQSCECEIVRNDAWAEGLAGTLRAAADSIAGFDGPVLVLGCDQPALEAEHLARLLEGARRSSANAAATLHDGLPGIPAVVPAMWFAEGALAGDRGFGIRLRALPRATVFLLDAPELEADLDTPHDVEAAMTGGWIDSV